MEWEQSLRELEALAKEPQGKGSEETIIRFDTLCAQTLVFDLSRLTERIDSLIILINGYAKKSGKPRVGIVQGVGGGIHSNYVISAEQIHVLVCYPL
jgi:hypothetical protein